MSGVLFGFVLFTVDLLLLVAIFRRLWRSQDGELPRAKTVILLIVGKLVILGGGIYLALVVYLVDALLLVVGSLLALVMFSLVFYHRYR